MKDVLVDSSPQMIAEAAFALHQLNSEYPITTTSPSSSSSSSSSEAASDIADHSEAIVVEEHISPVPIVGVRVSGFQFYFYSIPYSLPAVLKALETQLTPEEPTVVKYFPQDGLNVLLRAERPIIIALLDRLRFNIAADGKASVRRTSKMSST